MTKRQFVVLAFRLFALYLAFNLLTEIGFFFNELRYPLASLISRILAAGFAICVVLSLIWLLWRKSEWLMEKIFAIPALSEENQDTEQIDEATSEAPASNATIIENSAEQYYYETPISIEALQLVAFSLMGLWVVATHLPHLAEEIEVTFGAIQPASTWNAMRFWLPGALEVVAGLWLFLRPWQFQGWIEKFKPKAAPTDEIAN